MYSDATEDSLPLAAFVASGDVSTSALVLREQASEVTDGDSLSLVSPSTTIKSKKDSTHTRYRLDVPVLDVPKGAEPH